MNAPTRRSNVGSMSSSGSNGLPDMAADDAPKAGRREWIGLAVLALACVVYAMDLTVLHLAVPSLSEDLQPTSAQLLWIVDIYGFMVAGALITMGTLGDRIGRRRLLLIGAVAFGLASILCAFSTSPEMLIASRALLGIAGATIAPSTLSLIRNMFYDAHQRTVAIGVWITALLARRRDRAAARRRAARVLLVGLGVPPGRARDGAAARARADPAPGVPRSGRRPARHPQRGALARRRAFGRLRPQADRPGRSRVGRDRVDARRGRARCCVRVPPEEARGSAHRPEALPRACLQRVVGCVHARHPRAVRRVPLHLPVSAAGGRAVAVPCGPVDASFVRRVHRRLDAGAGDRAPRSSRIRHGCGSGNRRRRLRVDDAGASGLRARRARDLHGHLLARARAAVHVGQ